MATATIATETKTVETEVSEKVVKMELSLDEASVLRTLVGRVTGDRVVSNRKHTDAIERALLLAGISKDDCCHFNYGNISAQ